MNWDHDRDGDEQDEEGVALGPRLGVPRGAPSSMVAAALVDEASNKLESRMRLEARAPKGKSRAGPKGVIEDAKLAAMDEQIRVRLTVRPIVLFMLVSSREP